MYRKKCGKMTKNNVVDLGHYVSQQKNNSKTKTKKPMTMFLGKQSHYATCQLP